MSARADRQIRSYDIVKAIAAGVLIVIIVILLMQRCTLWLLLTKRSLRPAARPT